MVTAFCLLRAATMLTERSDAGETTKLNEEANRMESAFNTWYATRRIAMRLAAGAIVAQEAEEIWQELCRWEHFFIHSSTPYTYLDC